MTLSITISNSRTLIFHATLALHNYVCDLLDRVALHGRNAYTVCISMALL
jgi:hypothetical protein